MTTRTWYCATCGDTWDEKPSAAVRDDGGRHWDAHDYNLPLCAGAAIEVYICPVAEAEIVNSTMIAINNPYETDEERA